MYTQGPGWKIQGYSEEFNFIPVIAPDYYREIILTLAKDFIQDYCSKVKITAVLEIKCNSSCIFTLTAERDHLCHIFSYQGTSFICEGSIFMNLIAG